MNISALEAVDLIEYRPLQVYDHGYAILHDKKHSTVLIIAKVTVQRIYRLAHMHMFSCTIDKIIDLPVITELIEKHGIDSITLRSSKLTGQLKAYRYRKFQLTELYNIADRFALEIPAPMIFQAESIARHFKSQYLKVLTDNLQFDLALSKIHI